MLITDGIDMYIKYAGSFLLFWYTIVEKLEYAANTFGEIKMKTTISRDRIFSKTRLNNIKVDEARSRHGA